MERRQTSAVELVSKVPAAGIAFWVTKVLTTGMGEVSSDFLVTHLEPVVAVAVGAVAFSGALLLQFRTPRYTPWIYWLAVVMVSIFGTMAADVLHVGLGVPYLVSSGLFAVVLAAVFVSWQATEKTLSIHSITTRRREVFYWLAVSATFALGTAVGDLTAVVFQLGYLASGVVFAVLIAFPGILFWRFRLGAVLAFWWAYVLTRPLGASFADWIALPPVRGGLGWGTGPISLLLTALIIGCVAHLARTARRVDAPIALRSR